MSVKFLILALMSYILGSVPFSFIIAKVFKKVDLRAIGSGNPGATNVYRTCGLGYGLFAFFMDAAKGFLAVWLFVRLLSFPQDLYAIAQVTAFFCVIAGHNWTVFLKFKGGKGVATSAGGLLAIAWHVLLILVALWITLVWITRYVSLSSILSAASFPLLIALFGFDKVYIFFAVFLAVLTIARHKENIRRLMKGQESKIYEKKKN